MKRKSFFSLSLFVRSYFSPDAIHSKSRRACRARRFLLTKSQKKTMQSSQSNQHVRLAALPPIVIRRGHHLVVRSTS